VKNKNVRNKNVRNTDKDEVENEDDDDKPVKNKNVRNDDDTKELVKNIAKAIVKNVEASLKKKDEVENEDDDDKPVKNKNVRNTDKDDEKVKNEDKDEKKDSTVTNAFHEVLGDLVQARERSVSKLVDGIVTNSRGVYTKTDLAGKPFTELQKLSDFLLNSVQTTSVLNGQPIANGDNSVLDIPSTFPTT